LIIAFNLDHCRRIIVRVNDRLKGLHVRRMRLPDALCRCKTLAPLAWRRPNPLKYVAQSRRLVDERSKPPDMSASAASDAAPVGPKSSNPYKG
jgi:hypothetical protein